MTMAEQLLWNRKKMDKRAAEKEEEKKNAKNEPEKAKPSGPVAPKTKEELGKMTMAE